MQRRRNGRGNCGGLVRVLREIGRAIGVSHVTVREWTKEEPVSPASGGKDVADGVVGLQAGTTPNPRKMLDGLISTWSGRAETDRFAASLVERLLRQREALDAQDETRRDGCAYHLEANMIIELLVDLELYVRLGDEEPARAADEMGESAVEHRGPRASRAAVGDVRRADRLALQQQGTEDSWTRQLSRRKRSRV